MAAFQDAVEKLLWPGKRQGLGSVWRTEAESYLEVDEHYLPPAVVDIARLKGLIAPGERELKIGPIPKGTPVNLLGNLDHGLSPGNDHLGELAVLLVKAKAVMEKVKAEHLEGEQAAALLRPLVADLRTCFSLSRPTVRERGPASG